ncbi:unnamed protein product [Phaeothamnion confervicola]
MGVGTEFGGRIGETFASSEPWWPQRPDASGRPNVIVILCDDLGYADIGPFGSEIDTPNLDRLAAEGICCTNFHSTPMCSPSRAALLTGLNPHEAGFGHVANADPGFPGYAMELDDFTGTMPEAFRAAGYTTLMVGKWHLCKDSDAREGGSKHSWPLQRGFDRFYGVMDAFTNQHQPHRLVEDNHTVRCDAYPEGYFLTDDLTAQAVTMIREVKASAPERPFFLYFAHASVHAPLHAKPEDIAKYRGAYECGWDELRRQRFERQQATGIVREHARLPERNAGVDHDVAPWDSYNATDRAMFERYMEVYAAMVDNVDQSLGVLRAALVELGVLDDTIIVFTSDNGGSREGGEFGTAAYFRTLTRGGNEAELIAADRNVAGAIGGPRTMPHYPRGWAMASNTPFRMYKRNVHAGGHSVPLVVSWPKGLHARGELRDQYMYIADLYPTLADLAGVELPSARHGRPLRELAGTSMVDVLVDSGRPSPRREQLAEIEGHRGYYRDGWEIVTLHQPRTRFGDHEWELYDLVDDPTETTDLAAVHPDRVQNLAARWHETATAGQVFPLNDGSGLLRLVRPPSEEVLALPVRIVPGTPTLERYRSFCLIKNRSFRIVIDLDAQDRDAGVLVAHGDQGGGYVVYVLDGAVHFAYNEFGVLREATPVPLPTGEQAVLVDFIAPGGGIWDVTLQIAGGGSAEVGGLAMLAGNAPFEGIDVGADRRSPVSWPLYERFGHFPFSGTLHAVEYEPGPLAPDSMLLRLDELRAEAMRYD